MPILLHQQLNVDPSTGCQVKIVVLQYLVSQRSISSTSKVGIGLTLYPLHFEAHAVETRSEITHFYVNSSVSVYILTHPLVVRLTSSSVSSEVNLFQLPESESGNDLSTTRLTMKEVRGIGELINGWWMRLTMKKPQFGRRMDLILRSLSGERHFQVNSSVSVYILTHQVVARLRLSSVPSEVNLFRLPESF